MTRAGAVAAPTIVTPNATIAHGVVAWDERGRIVYAGPRDGWPGEFVDHPGCTIVPGFYDAHTHLPFFGWRDDEFEARLSGSTYRDQQGAGGGIPRSARMLATASDDEVLGFCLPLLDEMLRLGTTTLEMKTGYGLSVEAELRQARLARELAERVDQRVVVTLLACHAVPEGMARESWVRAVCDELIPRAAAEDLVDAVDIYVEDIAFTVEDLALVAGAAERAGLPLRCHAEQLGHTGAASAAALLGARSVDHLNHLDEADVTTIASAGATAVLLPASSLMLRGRIPPVDALRQAGVPIALASDFNPGTSAVSSMPAVMALGCALYGLSPDDALRAATTVPAALLGFPDAGTLEPGKRADLVVLEGEAVRMTPYRLGHDPVIAVVLNGDVVRQRSDPAQN